MRKRIPGGLNLRALAVLTAHCNRTRLHQVPVASSDLLELHGHGQRGNAQSRSTTKGGALDRYKVKDLTDAEGTFHLFRPKPFRVVEGLGT